MDPKNTPITSIDARQYQRIGSSVTRSMPEAG
jgi:hypothetical protein